MVQLDEQRETPRRVRQNRTVKEPFDIDVVVELVREAVRDLPKAALCELYDKGFVSPFEQLVACIISVRTLDEVTTPTAERLFAVARTPEALAALPVSEIERLIRGTSFPEPKARNLLTIAKRVCADFGGELPCDEETLLSLPGVGPKCTNLVLSIACDVPRIAVDVHVHRVTNRWGYVSTPTPEKTLMQLEAKLPKRYWGKLNHLLVPFGKHICTGRAPRCSTCLVLRQCRQVGVASHR